MATSDWQQQTARIPGPQGPRGATSAVAVEVLETEEYEYKRKLQNRLAQRRYRERLKNGGKSSSRAGNAAASTSQPSNEDSHVSTSGQPQLTQQDWNVADTMPWDSTLETATFDPANYAGNLEAVAWDPTGGQTLTGDSLNSNDIMWSDADTFNATVAAGQGATSAPMDVQAVTSSTSSRQKKGSGRHGSKESRSASPKEPPSSKKPRPGLAHAHTSPALLKTLSSSKGSGSSRGGQSWGDGTSSESSDNSPYTLRLKEKVHKLIDELSQVYKFGVDLQMVRYDPSFVDELQTIRRHFVALSNLTPESADIDPWQHNFAADGSGFDEVDSDDFGESGATSDRGLNMYGTGWGNNGGR